MKLALIALFTLTSSIFANDLSQAYEKAYFLETAKGQADEALEIYRKMVSMKATDENRAAILKALTRLQVYYTYPKTVEFQLGGTRFLDGDFIKVDQIFGSSEQFEVGGMYLVKGSYNLSSHEDAKISFFVTATKKGEGRTDISSEQQIHVKNGSGTFELSLRIPYQGWPHISFYPTNGGSGFGDIYFGTGNWLLKEITWKDQPRSLQDNIETFDMRSHDLDDVKQRFGNPRRYFFEKETFAENDLPSVYIMDYTPGFSILMHGDKVEEFRISNDPSVSYAGLSIGTPIAQAIQILGEPEETVTGEKCDYQHNTLYLDSEGRPKGHAYYAAKGTRIFFMREKIVALYITDNTQLTGK